MTGPLEPFDGRRGLWAQAVGKPVEIPQFPTLSKGGLGGGRGGIGSSGFRITNTTFKSFPSQIHTQAPIGLALELRPKAPPQDIAAIKIQSYRVAVSTAATEPEKWDPKTRETADHSIPYLVAAAFQDGAVTPASFTSQRVQDPKLRTLIAKMVIEEVEEFTRRYPAEYNCRMEVTDKSGQTYAAHTSYPKGHRLNPLDDSEVESKFRRLAAEVLSRRQSDRALGIAWSLEDLQNVEELFDSLVV
jgi:2-methylcitrate dehydratase